ncbi:MAG TPA: hypothetical protein VJB08_06735 [Candidatus Nanoarchaeia archaeon]|nr:hypothetical protein [Candidatus Nanoarchaeia archaeon]
MEYKSKNDSQTKGNAWRWLMFGLFKKKDPVCGMKKEEGKGLMDGGNWFCSESCRKEFKEQEKEHHKDMKGCCH